MGWDEKRAISKSSDPKGSLYLYCSGEWLKLENSTRLILEDGKS